MDKEILALSKLLSETSFEIGYESAAERYFNVLWDKHGIHADKALQKLFCQNMSGNHYLLKHILFIVGNASAGRRENLEVIPLAGISYSDVEIQDMAVKCFERWEDKKYLPALQALHDKTDIQWFKDYITDVIQMLNEE